MGDQYQADEHLGHCHALRDHHALPMSILCCRPRNHTGMHTSCGDSPGKQVHHSDCRGWYGQDTPAMALR